MRKRKKRKEKKRKKKEKKKRRRKEKKEKEREKKQQWAGATLVKTRKGAEVGFHKEKWVWIRRAGDLVRWNFSSHCGSIRQALNFRRLISKGSKVAL